MIDPDNSRGLDPPAHQDFPARRRFATIAQRRDRYQNRSLMSRQHEQRKGDRIGSGAHRRAGVLTTRRAIPVQTAIAPRSS
jgi:hypothetical protein